MTNDVIVDNKEFRKKAKYTNPHHRDHPAKGKKSAKRKPKQTARIVY